ncbi:hypothetical protein M0R89_19140 (plasmid) [Halorussus limi]|uniref:DUF4129 domain-containing protein n=1 Tax=Halorussus limi TaxID=2938695 RepID=A0A8U0I0E3_9EURY|nr:hypothetical protein [Halorussus limi]UPV76648.1 hypothetical protein M0R89_19140 [Halorussus limi]
MRGVDGERLGSVAVAVTLLFAAASGAVAAGASAPETGEPSSSVTRDVPTADESSSATSGASSWTDQPASRADGAVVAAQGTTTRPPGGNNTTVHHRNPGRVGEGSNASDVEAWLQDRMVERLVRSINVSERNSERARRLVGNDSKFEEFADKYAELKSDAASDDRNLSDLDGVGAIQSAFLADVQAYRTTLQRYRNARENDTIRRERRLAHELERRLAEVNRSAAALRRSYANVSTGSGDDTANVTRQIGAVRADVVAAQQTVRNQTLVRTRLSVRAVTQNGSFTDRVRLRGRLVTAANDSAIASRNVTLRIENRTVETRTNETGHFAVAYRPTLASVGDRVRSVRFRPANASRYLHDNATVRFGVERVRPEIAVTNRTRTVGFGDSLVVDGTVTAENVSTGGVPVAVTLAGFPVGRTTTAPNGSFDFATTVPANLSTGERRVRVRIADPQFRAANATVPVTVEPTVTALSMTEVRRMNGSLLVSGRLATEGGTPLPNRTLQLSVGGTAVGTVTTNATGGYAQVVPVPSSVAGSSNANVSASYSPIGGNLEPSRANATVTFETADGGPLDYPLALRVAGLLGLAVIGVVLAWRLGGDDWGIGDDATPETAAADLSETIPADTEQSADALLDVAKDYLEAGDNDDAVLLAYAVARVRLEELVGSTSVETHWEFYEQCREAGLGEEHLDNLKLLTKAYEIAAFAPKSVSETTVVKAVEVAHVIRSDEWG